MTTDLTASNIVALTEVVTGNKAKRAASKEAAAARFIAAAIVAGIDGAAVLAAPDFSAASKIMGNLLTTADKATVGAPAPTSAPVEVAKAAAKKAATTKAKTTASVAGAGIIIHDPKDFFSHGKGAGRRAAALKVADDLSTDPRFEADRVAAKNFKLGDKVEYTRPGQFRQADGSLKEGLVMVGAIAKVHDFRMGTFTVTLVGGGDSMVAASALRHIAVIEGPTTTKATTAKAAKAKATKRHSNAEIATARAAAGELPIEPDFSANTHKPYRKKLAAIVEMATRGDLKGLKAATINPTSTSPRAILRYRDLAIAALEARAAAAKAA